MLSKVSKVNKVKIESYAMSDVENPENDIFGSYYALLVAFKTMKERCQQLQIRMAAVEAENVCLRLQCGKDLSSAIVKVEDSGDKSALQMLQVCEIGNLNWQFQCS